MSPTEGQSPVMSGTQVDRAMFSFVLGQGTTGRRLPGGLSHRVDDIAEEVSRERGH